MPPVTTFSTCSERWGAADEEIVTLLDDSSQRIGTFPLAFLNDGAANTSSVQYLLRVCRLVLDIPVAFDLIISNDSGALDGNVSIETGTYRINGTFAHCPGPSGKTKSKPFRETDSASTVSKSSRSTVHQSWFKMELLLRDGRCLLTGIEELENLIACHIVPFSLGQTKLDEICSPQSVDLFSVRNGLLLTPTLHTAYDRYLWGIYTYEGAHFVHVFGAAHHEWHGKQIDYRVRNRSRLPNPKLLEWHYAQCLMARFRGTMVSTRAREQEQSDSSALTI